MYEIIIYVCYDEHSKRNQIIYKDLGFKTIGEACSYLGKHYNEILEEYPVDGEITIKYNFNKHQPDNNW